MSIIAAADLGEDFEDKLAPEGQYDLRVAKAEKKMTKAGDREMVALMIVIDGTDGDGISPINESLLLPKNGEERGTARMFMQRVTRFSKVFGIDKEAWFTYDRDTQEAHVADSIDVASLFTGLTAKCAVTQEEGNDGVMRNRLKLPRV